MAGGNHRGQEARGPKSLSRGSLSPSSDALVVRLKGSERGLALSQCSGRTRSLTEGELLISGKGKSADGWLETKIQRKGGARGHTQGCARV